MLTVRRITVGALETNCYIVYSESSDAIVIDPGLDSDRIIDVIEQLDLNVECIMLTHAHFDHMGAADIIADKYGCLCYLNHRDEQLLHNPDLNLSSRFFGNGIVYSKEYKLLSDDEKCTVIGHNATVFSTPGHTPGSCCIKIGDMIFTGDTLFRLGIGNQFPPYGNMTQEIKSIKEKLFVLEEDAECYPGHGDSTTLFYEKANNPYLNQGGSWIL